CKTKTWELLHSAGAPLPSRLPPGKIRGGGKRAKGWTMNLVLAGFWMLLALVAFFPSQFDPEERFLRLGQNSVLLGGVALLRGVYSLVRGWTGRSWAAQQRALREEMQRRHQGEERRPREDRPPDPNFDFHQRPPG